MTKEQAQAILNKFSEGKVWPSLDFETDNNYELGQYNIKHDLEQEIDGMDVVYMTFPAQAHYVDALERYHENPTEENGMALHEITEGDFEDFYDYSNPTGIESESDRYEIVEGEVI
ncbi:hypothetical protein LGV96_09715 [Streptococcus mutans]|nr:hypothetical protein [Streptococcus mutans]MCB5027980.1 hypothetical protein [Streptococcus mutans]MCB5031919.1 hypothetical protein [Streptococcus mutans]